jgi:2,3-bisphosphoglycerate-independent phosphoglycerate mutase
MKSPLILIIRDGWGINPKKEGNAILLGKTPNTNRYEKEYPHCVLKCHGEYVGLPAGNQGNSEVGHLNIGAGRVVYQSLTRIDKSIEDGSFFRNNAFLKAIKNCKKKKSRLHIMGLIQDQGVHAVTRHGIALLELAKKEGLEDVYVHAFTDGRDTPPQSAENYLRQLQDAINNLGIGRVASVMGRYYSMDRDNRWDRTELAYNALVKGEGRKVKSWKEAIEDAYSRKETDEFIKPRVIDFDGIKDKDSVIFFNYRLDRARQLTHAFTDKEFSNFKREKRDVFYVAFTDYYDKMNAEIAFPPITNKNLLGEVLSRKGLYQLRAAETEKYAHVTFFFNGQNETPFKNEIRVLINSPKVATYDLKPEMSAYEVTEAVIDKINEDKYDVIIINFANGDMVGHTGVLKAAIKAVETVDLCIGKIVDLAVKEKKGIVIITADHGNCEEMIDYVTGKAKTAHTTNDVPFIVVSDDKKLKDVKLRNGILADIAPTMLEILDIKKPKEMTGESLIAK